ncbi:MAG: sulfatase-like hydrolase/transferase [Oligoflexia bacterium]|nr:sulfatase-like hydrolase/transferase [Oligoflexia bacterium]
MLFALIPLLLACHGGNKIDTADLPVVGDTVSFYGDRPQNLLVISVDTYRRDNLVRYGGEPGNTTFLDGLADDSFVLDSHTVGSNWTKGGVACAVNGMYSYQWGLIPRLADQDPGPPRPTLSSMLAVYGYDTMLVTSNGWLLDAGLDGGYAYTEQPDNNRATSIAEAGISALTQRQASSESPWMLHLHFIEPHAAYNPPDEYLDALDDLPPDPWGLADREEHYNLLNDWPDMSDEDRDLLKELLWARYKGDVHWIDDELSQIWNDLDDRGLLDNTLVLFWTDHGEQFFEHDKQTHVWGLHPEENAGIAFFWARNIVRGSWTEPTNHIDLAPTVLTALGLDLPSAWTGQPVGTADPDRPIIAESWSRAGPRMSVTVSDHKLIYDWDGDKSYYDIVADPTEMDNIYDAKDPNLISMWDDLMPVVDRWVELVGSSAGDPVNPGP